MSHARPAQVLICWPAMMLTAALLAGLLTRSAIAQPLTTDKNAYLVGETVRVTYRLPGAEDARLVSTGPQDAALERVNLEPAPEGVIELTRSTTQPGPVRLTVGGFGLDDPPFVWIWVFPDLEPWPGALSVDGGARVSVSDEITVRIDAPRGAAWPENLRCEIVRPAYVARGGAAARERTVAWGPRAQAESTLNAPDMPGMYEIRLIDPDSWHVLDCLPLEVVPPSPDRAKMALVPALHDPGPIEDALPRTLVAGAELPLRIEGVIPPFRAAFRHAETGALATSAHEAGRIRTPSTPGPYELVVTSAFGDQPVVRGPIDILAVVEDSPAPPHMIELSASGALEVGDRIKFSIATIAERGGQLPFWVDKVRKEHGGLGLRVVRAIEGASTAVESLEPLLLIPSIELGQTIEFEAAEPGYYLVEVGAITDDGWVSAVRDGRRFFKCMYPAGSGSIQLDQQVFAPGDRVTARLTSPWPTQDDVLRDLGCQVTLISPDGARSKCTVENGRVAGELSLQAGVHQMRWYDHGRLIGVASIPVAIEPEPHRLRLVAPVRYGEPIKVAVEVDEDGFTSRAIMRVLLVSRGEASPTGTWKGPLPRGGPVVESSGVYEFAAPTPGPYELRLIASTRHPRNDASASYLIARLPVDAPGPGGVVPTPGAPDAPEPTDLPLDLQDGLLTVGLRMANVRCAQYVPLRLNAGDDASGPGGEPGAVARKVAAGAYQPPPFLALSAAVYPRPPAPGGAMTFGFRIQNRSRYRAAAVTVALAIADPRTGRAPRQLTCTTGFCEDLGDGRYRCTLGDMKPDAVADIVFRAQTPMSGMVCWRATLDSAGDLGGVVEHEGVLGERAPPRIVEAVVLADQQSVTDGVPAYPYPFGPQGRGKQSRYLLLVGHNLPQHPGDHLDLPDTETIHYGFLAYPDTNSRFYRELIADGWKRFYDLDDAAVADARAKADGYDAILVRADLLEGVTPGRRTVTASGAQSHWGLEFGDVNARVSFVRVVDAESFDLLSNAYVPERIHLAVETNMALPPDAIPLRLNPEELGAGQTAEIVVTARRTDRRGGRLYLTEPLDLHLQAEEPSLAGGRGIPVQLGPDSLGVLQARVDERFVFEHLRIPIDPPLASVQVRRTPAAGDHNWLWRSALARAAACHDDVQVDDWNRLSAAESEEIWNLMVFTRSDHFPGQSVKFGHHAAAILLRDMFVALTEKQVAQLEWIRGNATAVKGLLKYLKHNAARGNPLLRMEVDDFREGAIEFRHLALNDVTWLAEIHGVAPEAIEAWRERETVNALGQLIEATNEALEDARDAGDCDVEELVRLTGFGFQPVSELLKAELVSLAQAGAPGGPRRLIWTPDMNARFWVDAVAPLAAAVKRQQFKANVDTDVTLAAATFLAMPLMLAETTSLVIVAWAIDLLDLGVTTLHELSQYLDSEAELRFALGAAVTIGDERYADALENAKGWASTTFGIGSSLFGAAAGAVDAVPRLVMLRRVARGRHVAGAMEAAAEITTLRPVDLRDFTAFTMSAHVRRHADGANSLTVLERKALALADDYDPPLEATHILPAPDLPPAGLDDAFTPATPMRFDPDAQSDFATPRPPGGERIETPRSSGDVPNATDARTPEGGVFRFRTADGEQEVPLGAYLASGSTSDVYVHGEDPTLVVRITRVTGQIPIAATLDDFGETALRGVRSAHVRTPRLEATYDVADDALNLSRVTVAERVDTAQHVIMGRASEQMTVAEMMAFDGAMRDLNRQGLVWLDNKWNNFGFAPLDDGSGRVQIVVFDAGGILPVRAAEGRSAAEVARQIQLSLNGDCLTHFPVLASVDGAYRSVLRRDLIRDRFRDAFDYDALDLPEGTPIPFNARSGQDFDYVAPLFDTPE